MRALLFLIILANILAITTCYRGCNYGLPDVTNTPTYDNTTDSEVTNGESTTATAETIPEETTTPWVYKTKKPSTNKMTTMKMKRKKTKTTPTYHATTEIVQATEPPKEKKTKNPSPNRPMKPEPTSTPACSDGAIPDLRTRLIEFSSKFIYKLLLDHDNENQAVACSPLATLYFVGMLAIYSYGRRPSSELYPALNLKNSDQVRCTFLQLKQYIVSGENVEFSLAQGKSTLMFANWPYRFTDNFKVDLKNVGLGEAYITDFRQPLDAVNYMNDKAQKNTNGMIKTIFPLTDKFNNDTQLVVCEPVYIKFEWPGFNQDEMTTGLFITSSGTFSEYYFSQIQVLNYTYSSHLKAKVVVLNLDSVYKIMFCLPDHKSGLKSMILGLGHDEMFESIYTSLKPEVVVLKLPRITEINTAIPLNKILKYELRVPSIFHTSSDTLTNLVENDLPLSVSVARQQVYLQATYGKERRSKISSNPLLPGEIFNANWPFLGILMAKDLPVASFVIQR